MQLRVLGSSSAGNGYILTDKDGSALAIEAGVRATEYFRFNQPSAFAGVLVTHEHGDHAVNALQLLASYGLKVIATKGTIDALGIPFYGAYPLLSPGHYSLVVDGWAVASVEVSHDAVEPCGFVIKRGVHKILFLTDLEAFPEISHELLEGLTTVMIEANYDAEIAIRTGASKAHLDRVSASHLSIAQAEQAIKGLAGYPVENIILLHLSGDNSNAEEFKRRVQDVAPASRVYVADKGLCINDLSLF